MNPETDTLKYGEELRDGDKVLPEWELFRDDGRADEFYTVTRLDTASKPKLVRFIALYDDGYMHSKSYAKSYAWIVRKPGNPDALKMDPAIRDLWTAALRSGDYQQTTGMLCRIRATSDSQPAGYCCLGVLCEVAVKAGFITASGSDGKYKFFDGASSSLPHSVVVWAGLDSGDPIAFGNSMSAWNDSHRKNFAEIADLIDGIKP